MRKSPSPYIHHIIDAATKIHEYVEVLDEEAFENDEMTQDAIIRQLEIIGEACKHLEDRYRKSRPKIPWDEIIGMRNRLAHEYWNVDVKIVWLTATRDVPTLKRELLQLLDSIGE